MQREKGEVVAGPTDGVFKDALETRRLQLMTQLPGWDVWVVRNYSARVHAWSARPTGAQNAMVTVYDPDDLKAGCREIEAHIEDRILEAQDALEHERDGATPERLGVLVAAVEGLMALRVLLTAREAGIQL